MADRTARYSAAPQRTKDLLPASSASPLMSASATHASARLIRTSYVLVKPCLLSANIHPCHVKIWYVSIITPPRVAHVEDRNYLRKLDYLVHLDDLAVSEVVTRMPRPSVFELPDPSGLSVIT